MIMNSAGTFLLNRNGGDCHAEKLCPDTYGADLNLDHTIASVGIFDDTIAALCNDVKNHQLEVYTYQPDTDVMDSFAINDVRYYGDCGFCYDSNSIYLVSDRNSKVIERYSTSGKLLDSYSFNSSVSQLSADYRGNVFAVSAGSLFRLNKNRFIKLSNSDISVPISFCTDNIFTDASGKCFEISGNTVRYRFSCNANYGKTYACLISGTLYYPIGNTVYGYSLSDGKKVSKIELNDPILGLYANKGSVNAVNAGGNLRISKIRPNEFTDLLQENTDSQTEAIQQNNTDQGNTLITSSAYHIDYNSYSITDIPSGTTLAQLKKNIRYDGYQVSFFRDGSVIKSGQCGTAMTAVFENDHAKYTFELSVIGDITGEGNVNSRDLKLLMQFLIGIADFNGVYLTSADLSGDSRIDVKDLAMMHRMI